MKSQTAAALGLGLFAMLIGGGWVIGALARRRRREEIAQTYAATGGVAYTVMQIGCGGALLLAGLVIAVIVLFGGFR